MADDVTIWCFVEGGDRVFDVDISKHKNISALQDEIYLKWFGMDNAFGPKQLELLKVHIPIPPSERISPSLRAPDNATTLLLRTKIDDHWPKGVSDTHIQVCARAPQITRTRAFPETEDLHARQKRSKIATETPSSLATSVNYKALQEHPSERLLYDRPGPDQGLPPIPLLYTGFGHFLDITDGRDAPGLADIKVADLQNEVDALAKIMSEFHDDEGKRSAEGIKCLRKIFQARRGTEIPQLAPVVISGNVTLDGHNLSNRGTTSIITEFKNEATGVKSHPHLQIAGYMAHLNKQLSTDMYLQWRVPCLGITIVGADITFYAVVAVSHQLRMVSLTPTYSCTESASNGRDRQQLYRAFAAASVLQAHILDDAANLQTVPTTTGIPIIPAHSHCYPVISKLSHYISPGTDLSFEVLDEFDDRTNHHLYTARTRMSGIDEIILIKFTKRYSIELHAFCASAGHAPKILGYDRLPGGWFAVAMEYVADAVSITKSRHLILHQDRWTRELNQLVTDFHAQDLVHGDLRDTNIICKDKTVMLVDFDWGGEDGKAVYPTLKLHPELLEGRVSTGFEISKHDDVRVLAKTLSKLKK